MEEVNCSRSSSRSSSTSCCECFLLCNVQACRSAGSMRERYEVKCVQADLGLLLDGEGGGGERVALAEAQLPLLRAVAQDVVDVLCAFSQIINAIMERSG